MNEDKDPNEEFICGWCMKPVTTRILFCSEKCSKDCEIDALRDKNGWIKVSDRKPDEFQEVMFLYLVFGNAKQNEITKRDIVCGHLANGLWHVCYLYTSIPLNAFVKVIAWQPLPKDEINE